MKAMVTSLPPLSAAEILYALAEEEGSEVDEHAGAGVWGDDADGGCGDDSDEYMDVAELETPAVAAHVVGVPRPFSNVVPRAPIVQTASAAPNVQVHDLQHLDSTLNCHQYVNTAAVRQLVGVRATEIAAEPQQFATEYAGPGTGEEDADAGAERAERAEFEAVIANSYFEMLGAQPEVVPTEINRGNNPY